MLAEILDCIQNPRHIFFLLQRQWPSEKLADLKNYIEKTAYSLSHVV